MFPTSLFTRIFCFSFLLVGCSRSSPPVHPVRITAQKGHSVILYPQEEPSPPPCYPWLTPKLPVISPYSFYCHGTSLLLATDQVTLYDCNGLTHSVSQNFSIYPRLITITRLLHTQYPLTIREGFCCPKHFLFLRASGEHISTRHLKGAAAILYSAQEIPLTAIKHLLAPLYEKKKEYPFSTEIKIHAATVGNGEFLITCLPQQEGTLLHLDLLYDIESSQPIHLPPSPMV